MERSEVDSSAAVGTRAVQKVLHSVRPIVAYCSFN